MMLVCPPAGTDVRANVIFGHPASGGRTTFLEEARALAQFGVRSYLLDFEFQRDSEDPAHLKNPEHEIRFRRRCLLKVQEASDLLSGMTNDQRGDRANDKTSQIYVGKNFGAFIGGMASSLDTSISRYILIAGLPDLTSFYVSSDHPVASKARAGVSREYLERYFDRTRPWNPVRLLPLAKKAEIFFQFGERDDWIPKETAEEFIRAATGPKTVKFYDDDHDLNSEEAARDRTRSIMSSISC
jgi:hypothetical protein